MPYRSLWEDETTTSGDMVGDKSNDQDSLLHLPTLQLGEVDPDPSAGMPAPPLPEPRQPDLGRAKDLQSEPLGSGSGSPAKLNGRPKVLDNVPIVSPQEQEEMTKSKRQKEKDQAAQGAKQQKGKAKAKAKAKAAAKGKTRKSTKRQTKCARVKSAQKAQVAQADTEREEPAARRTRRKVADRPVATAATAEPKAPTRKRAAKRTMPEETHAAEDATHEAAESSTRQRQAKPKASPKKKPSPKKKDTHSRKRVSPEVAARNSRKSSAYHVAYNKAIKEGDDKDLAKLKAKQATSLLSSSSIFLVYPPGSQGL